MADPATWLDLSLASAEPPLPGNAVAALLVVDDGRYVMQLRDAMPKIFYPDHWGCFGGAVHRDEAPIDALKREVLEELEYPIEHATEFTRLDLGFAPWGHPSVFRIYFVVRVPSSALAQFRLHEGAAVEAISGQELLTSRRVTPYDAFAVWLHISTERFAYTSKPGGLIDA